MITPTNGTAWWARRGLWPPLAPNEMQASPFSPDSLVIQALSRALGRIEGYEHLGLDEDVRRELESLPPALRELPSIQLRLAGALERLARFDDALTVYGTMEQSTLAQLGRVRCMAQLGGRDDAGELLARIEFDAAAVKQFVETRALLG
jgi:hypothetical protein